MPARRGLPLSAVFFPANHCTRPSIFSTKVLRRFKGDGPTAGGTSAGSWVVGRRAARERTRFGQEQAWVCVQILARVSAVWKRHCAQPKMRPRSLSCRPARCTSAHHIPNDRATSLRGLSATLLLVMLPMALEEAVANGLPAGTLSAFATGIPRLGAAGRQRDEAVCAFDSSRPRCLSALRQARRARDLARAAAADGTSVGLPSASNAADSGSSDVGSSPEISAEQKQDETEEALQSDNDMLRVKPRVEEPKGGKPGGRLSRIKRRILTLWDRSGSAHNTSPRANMSSAPQSTGQKKFLTAQRNTSQTPVSYEASMRASDVPGKSRAATESNKSVASTLGARKQMQLQTSTERYCKRLHRPMNSCLCVSLVLCVYFSPSRPLSSYPRSPCLHICIHT